ncbi:MAG: hypothetical protein B9S26_03765 [Opitutia bacterium Tous-C4FEB]|nr:MAG: hypothetical protein B9S35_01530 [Opitutae bacterium Tous-C5TDCM]PAW90562.1 MAG: hypothetical protein B9S26_03765 [Opitutae bacterium Tous-C4FEB]
MRRNRRYSAFARAGFPEEAVESELAILEFTQVETGAALLGLWDFPASIPEPERWQYVAWASVSAAKMDRLLAAANWLRSAVCMPIGEKSPPAPDAAHLQLLGIGVVTL